MIGGNAKAEFDNVKIETNNKWMYVEIVENPSVVVKHYRSPDPNIPWWNSGWNSSVTIEDSIIGISVHGNTKLQTKRSDVFFELLFGNSSGTFTLPIGFVENFLLDVPSDQGIFSIHATNSTIRQWGTTLMYNSDIVFVDSVMTIGINAGSSWPEYTTPQINITGLKARRYDFFALPFDTNHLTLFNTTVTSWYPQAFGGAVMELSNCDLADLQWNGDNANVIVKNSSLSIAYARHNVTYEIYDSAIGQDVTATDNSRIYLYNTRVGGDIQETESGRVIVQ